MTIRRFVRLGFLGLMAGALSAMPAVAQQEATQSIPLFGDTSLEVEIAYGGARFVPIASSTEEAIVIHGQVPPPSGALPIQSTRVGKRVIVTIGRGTSNSQIPFVSKTKSTYEVDYPAHMKLLIHAFGGDVDVVKPTTAVTINGQGGDVLVENPHAPVAIENGAGQVVVHQAVAALDLAADSGNVSADLDPSWLRRPIRMQSAAGNLHLVVPQNFSARVDVSSQSGAVHNALARDAMTASGPPVWLYTEQGDVTIGFPAP